VEVNYALEGDLSPEASDAAIKADRRDGPAKWAFRLAASARSCSGRMPSRTRTRSGEERGRAGPADDSRGSATGTDNLLVVPGSVYARGFPTEPPVPHDVALERATAAVKSLIPLAQQNGVSMNMENIFPNGFLHSPQEMNAFVDGVASGDREGPLRHGKHHAVPLPRTLDSAPGKRIKNIPPQGIQQESPRVQPQRLPLLLRRHDRLAPPFLAASIRSVYRGYFDVRVLQILSRIGRRRSFITRRTQMESNAGEEGVVVAPPASWIVVASQGWSRWAVIAALLTRGVPVGRRIAGLARPEKLILYSD